VGTPQSASPIVELIEQLDGDARNHKRLSRQHRDLARRNIAAIAELRAWCEANGIPVDRVEAPPSNICATGEPHSHTTREDVRRCEATIVRRAARDD
jgi:hypothetical protein